MAGSMESMYPAAIRLPSKEWGWVRRSWVARPPSISNRPALAKAAITGDYALIGSEVPEVVRALRSNGIEVTAIHSHMLTEEPRIFFLHFWANDDALKLARGLRAALDKTASARS